ncbi:galactose oxidase-like domain-containing protein [Streptomyces sp. NPDC059816]|uniref:galactose oxidase-like domain-containing protein n=1 Tax=Streptomyces sp. NPDC059816 TaxID=3346960 RepID=UPI003665D333
MTLTPARVRPAPRARTVRRRRTALLGVVTMVAGLLLATPQTAAAANLLTNPGFETPGPGGSELPHCWSKAGWGDNDFTYDTVSDARTGTAAVKVALSRRASGDRKAMLTENPTCAPTVQPGTQYDLSLWYKSTTPDTAVTLFRRDTTGGWQYWTDLRTLPVAPAYERVEVRTPPIPPGTDQITWGVSVYGVGSVTTDDYAMHAVAVDPPDPLCTGTPTECRDGRWDVLPTKNPVRSAHAVVLHNGKVLLIAGSGNSEEAFAAGTFTSAIYDPADGSYRIIPTPKDMFCAGHVQLRDGKVLVMGGNLSYPAANGSHGYKGYRDSYVFDPATETYTKTNDMNDGHWYPSATVMGNGDVLSFGGLRDDSTGSVTADRFSAAQNRWLPTHQVKQTWSYWGLYPSMILMQDGRLFYSGSHVFGNGTPGTGASVYDYDANTITDVPGLQRKDERDQSASVLLPPAQDQKVLTIGGGNIETNPKANRLTDIIDLKDPNPQYTAGPPLPQGTVDRGGGQVPQTGDEGKMYVSAVLLPDGKVMETGGSLHNRADPVFSSSLFDPVTRTFDKVATDPEARGYHSSSFLLPDGRVMSTGDNPGSNTWNHNVSIYTPPYLMKGPRPAITSVADNEWTYGSTQRITVDRAITKAQLIRPSAVTHSSDPNQRFVDLPLTVNGNTIDLNVTSNPNLAPPGWYMLFATDANGVPSVAKWVRLDGPAAMSPAASGSPGSGGHGGHHGGAGAGAGAAEAPAPHVQDFADDLSAKPRKPLKKRGSQPVSPTVSGCDRHYGAAGVCVPTDYPPQVKATTAARCDWLARHDYGRLKVNGETDPQRLDPDRDGIACGKGDLRGKRR